MINQHPIDAAAIPAELDNNVNYAALPQLGPGDAIVGINIDVPLDHPLAGELGLLERLPTAMC